MNEEYLYDKFDEGVIIQGYLGTFAEIPFEIKGKKVVAVGQIGYENKSDVLNSKSVKNANRRFYYGNVKKAIVKGNVRIIKCYAFYGSRNLEFAEVGEKVTEIENGVFLECSRLKAVIIRADIKRIPSEMFKGCSALKSVAFLQGVTEVGVSAFEGCANLEGIVTDRIKKICRRAFFGCMSVTSIKLGKLKEIASLAFSGCSLLAEFEIEECDIIGDDIFKGCGNISVIRVKAGGINMEKLLESLSEKVNLEILYGDEIIKITVPLYKNAYRGCIKERFFDFEEYDRISADNNDVEIAFGRLESGFKLSETGRKRYIECLRDNVEKAVEIAGSLERLKFLCEKTKIINEGNIKAVLNIISENTRLRAYIIDYGRGFLSEKYVL